MKGLGFLLVFVIVQLLVLGSIIQRGNKNLIPVILHKKIKNMPMYCKMFGNRLILLGLITIVGAWKAFSSEKPSFVPLYIIACGIILVVALMIYDYKKYNK